MDERSFKRVAEWISTTYEVVPLLEIAVRIKQKRSLRGLASLTFDDAYHGIFQYALPVLQQMKLPATVFIVSEASECPRSFWWDRLGSIGLLTPNVRSECLTALKGAQSLVLQQFPQSESVHLQEDLLPAGWATIISGSWEGLTVGSHTASHRNLATLSREDARTELVASRKAIQQRLAVDPVLMSYPYGLHSKIALEEADRAGYLGGTILGGSSTGLDCHPLALKRINVPAAISVEALDCWAAGCRIRNAK